MPFVRMTGGQERAERVFESFAMSLKKLDKAIAALPPQNRGPQHVEQLRAAAGSVIDTEEAQRLSELQEKEWKLFNPAGRAELEALVGTKTTGAATFTLAGQHTTGLSEQSALTFISAKHGLVIVTDDDSTVWRLPLPSSSGGAIAPVAAREGDGALKGLEGAIYDADHQRLLVVSEDTRQVHALPVSTHDGALSIGKPKLLGALADVQEQKNKGWEGIAILPGSKTGDGKPRIIAAHEGSPRGVGVFDPITLELEALVKLPKAAKDALDDLSDLTVDPKSGRVLLLSHESHAVFEVELSRSSKMIGGGPPVGEWTMAPIGGFALPKAGKGDARAEGIAFDHHGDLWVSCETGGRLLHLARET